MNEPIDEDHLLDEPVTVGRAELTETIEEILVCDFTGANRHRMCVTVNFTAAAIQFENCLYPRKLITLAPLPTTSCSFDDVILVYRLTLKSDIFTIVTTLGTVNIPSTATHYVELCSRLRSRIPNHRRGADAYHPLTAVIAWGGVFGGIFLGWFLTPQNGSSFVLALCVTAGAIVGFIAPFVLVMLADRVLKISIVLPLGFAIIGASLGLAISHQVAQAAGAWNSISVYLPIILGAGGGLLLGIIQQLKDRNRGST